MGEMMRFFIRRAAGLVLTAIALAARGSASLDTPRGETEELLPTQPDVDIPAGLTPITVSGTPVIIPSAIEFTPTAPPSIGGKGTTPTPLPTGFPPEAF